MRIQSAILGLFNIHAHEFDKFIRLLAHAFLNGLGLALSFTAINVLVLDRHGVEALPYMYVGASLVLLISGLVYSKLEHKIAAPRLFAMALVFCAIWAFAMRFTITFQDSIIALSIAFCTYYLVYLLSNLEFWGSAALLFNIRQGKRIFGPLTTGESVAKLLGFGLSPVIATVTCMEDALLISALCFALSYFILKRLVSKYHFAFTHGHSDHSHTHHKKTRSFLDLGILDTLKALKRDRFVLFLSAFALISTMAYFIIYYGFMDRIKLRYKKQEDIALFFGTFLFVAKVINHFVKIFFTSRLLNYIGVRKVLYILPIVLLLINLVGIVGFLNHTIGAKYFVTIMILNMGVDYALRTSLYTPSYLIMFQPLTKSKRLEGHTLSKGIMEPIGIGLAGICILLFKYFDFYYVESYIMIILVLAILMLIFARMVGTEYILLLKRALKAKIFNQGTFELSLEERTDLRKSKLTSDDPVNVIYAAQLLEAELSKAELEEVVERLLNIEIDHIIAQALNFISRHNMRRFSNDVKGYIVHPDLGEQAAFCYASLMEEECVDELLKQRSDWDERVKTAVIGGVLKHSGLYGAVAMGQEFLEMMKSEEVASRIGAARIIGQINNPDYYHPLMILMNDPSIEVRRQAIISAGMIKNPKLIETILEHIDEARLFFDIKRALAAYGNASIISIIQSTENAQAEKLINAIRLLAQFDDYKATSFLIDMLKTDSFQIHREAVIGLSKHYRVFDEDMSQKIDQCLTKTIEVLRILISLYGQVNKKGLFKEALKNEIIAVQLPLLLNLLSLKYDSDVIAKIKDNTEIKEGDFRSNALELLENHLSRKDAARVVPILDKVFMQVESGLKSSDVRMPLKEVISQLFSIDNGLISNWLKAVAIRTMKDERIGIDKDLLSAHDLSHKMLEQEFAQYQM